MNSGYIRVWRKSLFSRVFQNEGLWKIWTWCLLKGSYKERWVSISTGRGQIEVEIKAGQFIFGRESAARELKMNPSTVWKRIVKLKNMGNLNIESNRQYSIVSIINWDSYQCEDLKSDSESNYQVTGKEQPSDRQVTQTIIVKNSKEGKEGKEGKRREETPLPDWINSETWTAFLDHRKYIKKPASERAQKMILKQLEEWMNKGHDPNKVLETSIINGWQGIFEPIAPKNKEEAEDEFAKFLKLHENDSQVF